MRGALEAPLFFAIGSGRGHARAIVQDLSVILWARHIMRVKSHGYADEEEETNGGLAGSGPRAAA
ncbi:hypothetical protein WK16_12840 [Burkholderia ubonensis]|nr:hypothetical protein WK16_12840 [Burkholderia ubonensis]